MTLHNIVFVFTELSSTQLALKNTVILGAATATIGTMLALVIAYVTTRRVIAGSRCSAFSPPRRSRCPASCSASGCS